jgi:Fur family transcriptional regulator, zinc uptake regulator
MRFTAKTELTLDAAAAACTGRGAQLTPLRRTVLGLVLESPRPVGAYALLDQLKSDRARAAPPTVYRALEFLLEQRLVHRLEKLNAFIACHVHDCGGPNDKHGHEHPAQFLICGACGTVTELEEPQISRALDAAASRAGFRPSRATVEIEGTCAHCLA